MTDHDWRRHGPFLACTACQKIWRQAISLEPCPKPKKDIPPTKHTRPKGPFPRQRSNPNHPTCQYCRTPLFGIDLESYLETGGEVAWHNACALSSKDSPK